MPTCFSPLQRATLLVATFALFVPGAVLAQSFIGSVGQQVIVATGSNSGTHMTPAGGGGGSFNDVLIQSISIITGSASASGNSVGATAEPNDNPSASCTFGGPNNDGDNSVWWWFVASSNGTVTIDMDGSAFDTILTLLDSSLNEVGCNDDDPGNPPGDFTSRIESVPVVANNAYFVRVTGYQGDEGDLAYSFSGPVTRPPNDSFWLRIREDVANYLGDNRRATADSGELSASCTFQGTGNDGMNSVWRRFTAPSNGMITISTTGAGLDGILTITNATRSSELACADATGTGGTETIADFAVTAGTSYDIRVSGWQGSESPFSYVFNFSPAVANEPEAELPGTLSLDRAFPNPFQDGTTVAYTLSEAGTVRVAVYDLLGRQVSVLVDGMQAAGSHTATFDGASLPSGVYVVRVEHEGAVQTQRITLAR